MKYIIIAVLITIFTSCNVVKKDDISLYNDSFLKHSTKSLITEHKIEFSNSISNQREKTETSRPLILNDKELLVGAVNYLYKVNYHKGFVSYKKKLPFSIFGNINLVDKDKIIFFASNGNIYLTDFKLEKIYWKYQLINESVIGDYKIVDNDIIFKTSKDRLYSLNKETSKLNWVTKSYLSDYMPLSTETEPLIAKYKIFLGFSNGKIAIFDRKTGKTLYEDSITSEESFNDITSSVTLYNDTIFIPSYRAGIVAIDIKTKTKNWSTNISAISKLFIVGKVGTYFSSDEMIKISIETGKILKRYKLEIRNPINYFLYKNKYIVISSKEEGIYLIDINNLDRSSKIGISSGISIKPILRGNKLIILTNNSNLYVLKIK